MGLDYKFIRRQFQAFWSTLIATDRSSLFICFLSFHFSWSLCAFISLSLSLFCVRYSLLFFLIFVDSITGPETRKEKVGIIPTHRRRRSAWLRSNLLKIYSSSWISSATSLTMIHVDKILFSLSFDFSRKVFINSVCFVCFFSSSCGWVATP